MNHAIFSTIRAITSASEWFAVYAQDTAPFYLVSRLQCLVAGRTESYSPRSHTWEQDKDDTIAFMTIDDDGVMSDPMEMNNFLTICHERDITEVEQERWSQLGREYLEKNRKKAQL
jgi:hypothetical protein